VTSVSNGLVGAACGGTGLDMDPIGATPNSISFPQNPPLSYSRLSIWWICLRDSFTEFSGRVFNVTGIVATRPGEFFHAG